MDNNIYFNKILIAFSDINSVHPDLAKTKSRKREFVETRQLCMFFLKKRTTLSLAKIGGLINKDHATVLHAVKTINNLIDTNASFKGKFAEISKIEDKIYKHCMYSNAADIVMNKITQAINKHFMIKHLKLEFENMII